METLLILGKRPTRLDLGRFCLAHLGRGAIPAKPQAAGDHHNRTVSYTFLVMKTNPASRSFLNRSLEHPYIFLGYDY
jgi:hypothetical protein